MTSPKVFEDLVSFAAHLTALQMTVQRAADVGLKRALTAIENDAKAQIGHYQPEVGAFPAWADLAPSTEAEKARMGAPADAPLLRTGGLYASFRHDVVSPMEGVVGSTDPTMVFHEFGTPKMPPRPVMGPAVLRTTPQVKRILGAAVVQGILGGQVVPGGGEYFGGDLTE